MNSDAAFRLRDGLRRLFRAKESSIFLALVAIVALISAVSPNFLRPGNLTMVARQVAFTAIAALGVFFVILTGGIDLSIGSLVSLGGIVCGFALAAGLPWPLAAAGGLLTGACVGAVNGIIVAYIGVTSFIVTLGMLWMARGAVLVLTGGEPVKRIPVSFITCAGGDFLGIPVPVWILAILAVLSHLLVTRTVYGRRLLAVGGNEEATELSGINVRRVKFFTYVLSGLYAAVTGVLYVARFQTAQPEADKNLVLDAIAATVIGGTSLFGGEGSVPGVLIGAMIMGAIRSGLVQMKVSPYWQDLIIGAIIVLAAVIDVARRRKSR